MLMPNDCNMALGLFHPRPTAYPTSPVSPDQSAPWSLAGTELLHGSPANTTHTTHNTAPPALGEAQYRDFALAVFGRSRRPASRSHDPGKSSGSGSWVIEGSLPRSRALPAICSNTGRPSAGGVGRRVE